jgi:hypothetical protein
MGAIEPTIAVAILIGLGQEIRQLWRSNPPSPPPRASFVFARRFAMLWRILVALTMLAGGGVDLVERAQPIPADTNRTSSLVDIGFAPIMLLCLLIVLCNCIERWRPKTVIAKPRMRRTRWLALVAVPLATLVVLHSSVTMYLTHWGLSGIEASQPPRFRRPGVYLTPVDQNLLPFWFGSLALASLAAAALLLLRFVRRRDFATASLWNVAAAVLLLAVAGTFWGWFFTTEFRVLSPELFEAGFEALSADWFAGAILAATIAGAVAYRLARPSNIDDMATIDGGPSPESIPFHQSAGCVALIGLQGLYGLFTLIQMFLTLSNTIASFPGSSSLAWISSLCDPLTLLLIALSLASLQFCWIRWQRHTQEVPWQLAALSRAAWYKGFIVTLGLFAVGIPTLHAFSFICWLMPWNVKALFGY